MMKERPVPARYTIRVRGVLDPRLADWFDSWTIGLEAGDTTLRGVVADPAALYGLISRLRDLGLELLAVARDEGPPDGGRSR
jgi:hypothetical protein